MAFGGFITGSNGFSEGPLNVSLPVTGGPNKIVFFAGNIGESGNPISSVTAGGTTMTRLDNTSGGRGLFAIVNPVENNGNVQFVMSKGGSGGGDGTAIAWYFTSPSATGWSDVQVVSSSTTTTADITNVTSDDFVTSVYIAGGTGRSVTIGANQSEIATALALDNFGILVASNKNGVGTVTHSYTWSGGTIFDPALMVAVRVVGANSESGNPETIKIRPTGGRNVLTIRPGTVNRMRIR
jgi:hypothetical protein